MGTHTRSHTDSAHTRHYSLVTRESDVCLLGFDKPYVYNMLIQSILSIGMAYVASVASDVSQRYTPPSVYLSPALVIARDRLWRGRPMIVDTKA